MLRWGLQHGHSVVPKSTKPSRVAENINVFDFELSADEMAASDGLDIGRRGGQPASGGRLSAGSNAGWAVQDDVSVMSFPTSHALSNMAVVIDAHHHLWDLAAREHRWLQGGQPWATDDELAQLRRSFTLSDLAPLAAAAGVTGTVVIQAVPEPWETPDLLALAAGLDPYTIQGQAREPEPPPGGPVNGSWKETPDAGGLLAGVVGWTDLSAPGVADAVAGLRALPGGAFLCGIRHPVLFEADAGWLAQPAVLRGLHALAAAGLSFDIVTLPHQLPGAVTAARSVPELSFVLDHLGGPPVGRGAEDSNGPWVAAIRSLAALPNVTCKLSGMHGSPACAGGLRPYYETVLAAFGPDRLMFGSDWPVSARVATYGQVCDVYRELTAQLSAAEQDAVFDHTARRVYRLPAPESGRQHRP